MLVTGDIWTLLPSVRVYPCASRLSLVARAAWFLLLFRTDIVCSSTSFEIYLGHHNMTDAVSRCMSCPVVGSVLVPLSQLFSVTLYLYLLVSPV
jgi:hypothetical protein